MREKLERKIREWSEKVGEIPSDENFRKWIDLNLPLVVAPLYDQVTLFNHSDVFFAVRVSKSGEISSSLFGIGAFAPQITEKHFEELLFYRGGQELFNLYLKEKESIAPQVVSYCVAVDSRNGEWNFLMQTLNPQKAVVRIKTAPDGKAETETYAYDYRTGSLISPAETVFSVRDGKEQGSLLSLIRFFSPAVAEKAEKILSLSFSLDSVGIRENLITLYFEPILT